MEKPLPSPWNQISNTFTFTLPLNVSNEVRMDRKLAMRHRASAGTVMLEMERKAANFTVITTS